MPDQSTTLDHTFTAPIGVDVKGEVWPCVELAGATELLGTGRSVRVDATVDDVPVENVGLMPTGRGELMLSLNAKLRKRLGKDVGDTVAVHLTRRLT
ncbi:hypothetical protein GCM10009718_34110 [Isoptericola halotolerans]|uniref:DUF1905 domain-containing protein n=1 Tax=Isoptericola halotolerans TaxID=300560 RepID=A0ABX2A2I2_9MICO|nr:DUF1905 domain-containing protein [Isoptericola halotolerans]NOV97057.1 hypothetical protein [Isoptericola halotolerans]